MSKLSAVPLNEEGSPIELSGTEVVIHSCPADGGVLFDDVFLSLQVPAGSSGARVVTLTLDGVSWDLSISPGTTAFDSNRLRLFPGQSLSGSAAGSGAVVIGFVTRARR